MTSSDVVVYLRRCLNIKKIGHAGTLDPGATGVLVVCMGKATKLSEYIMAEDKSYYGGMILGIDTDTLDAHGKITQKSSQLPCLARIQEAFKKYKGVLMQDPPMYSARKYKGKRLYELARQGQEVKVPPREVQIFKNDIIEYIPPNYISFKTECTKGTYIRSLVRDIGEDLGCGAYLSFLIRTGSGMFCINHSHTLQEIKESYLAKELNNILKPMDSVLSSLGEITLDHRVFNKVIHGNALGMDAVISDITHINNSELIKVYCRDTFIGLGYINSDKMIKMRKVLV